jgi:hypothetical protein
MAMTQKHLLKTLSAAMAAFLVGGWGWPWQYGSRFEAQKACADWVKAGPRKYVSEWQYQIRLKDTSGSDSWSHYGLNLPKSAPVPGEWSPTLSVKRKSDIPKHLKNEEIKSWFWSANLPVRGCIHERDTHQILGTEKNSVIKRFQY